MPADPFAQLYTGRFWRPEANLTMLPIGTYPAVIVDGTLDFQRMVVINEIVDTKLPEKHGGVERVEYFVQNQIFLQRAIAPRSIGKDFHAQLSLQQGMVGMLIGNRRGLSEGVPNDEKLWFARPHIPVLPESMPAL